EGPAKVYELDLTAGWQAATEICFPTIAWRKRGGLITELAAPALPAVAPSERVDWLRQRVVALVDAGHKGEVAARWPAGVPTLKQGGLTDADIDQVALTLDQLEAEHGIPFGPVDPLLGQLATADLPPAPTQ